MPALECIKKNVLKVYDAENIKAVFLKDGSEFEIELFNPLQVTVLAKIKLNGEWINGGGLILKPGQRVFLERYLDEDKKFKFDTYKVEAENKDVDFAIKNNGLVEILFYKEIGYTESYSSPGLSYTHTIYNPSTITIPNNWGTGITLNTSDSTCNYISVPTSNFASSSSNALNNIGTLTSATSKTFFDPNAKRNEVINSTIYCNNNASEFECKSNRIEKKEERKEKETGTVEKGSKSDQALINVSKYFDNWSFYFVKVKILPEGEKMYNTEDIKHKSYCSNCGNKIKPNDKFCSNCGEKI